MGASLSHREVALEEYTVDRLFDEVGRLNVVFASVWDLRGKSLSFSIVQTREDLMGYVAWKSRVTIEIKLLSERQMLSRGIDLVTFVRLASCIEESRESFAELDVSASSLFAEIERSPSHEDLCLVCFERPATDRLECSHAFCRICLGRQNENCPTCGGLQTHESDEWEIVHKPAGPSDVAQFVAQSLFKQ